MGNGLLDVEFDYCGIFKGGSQPCQVVRMVAGCCVV